MKETPIHSPRAALGKKLLAPVLGLSVAFLLAGTLAVFWTIQRQVDKRLRERGEVIATFVASVAENIGRVSELQRVVTAIGAEPDVELVVLVAGAEPRVVASTQHRWLGRKLDELPGPEIGDDLKEALRSREAGHTRRHIEDEVFDYSGFVRLALPDLAEVKPTDGAVMVHLSTAAVRADVRHHVLEFTVFAGGGLLAVALLAYALIARHLLSPLARINAQLPLISGDTGEIDPGASRNDEIGRMVHALNQAAQERRARDAALREEREKLLQALRDLREVKLALDEHAIVAITDAKGRITFVNDKFCAISQYSRAELLGQDHRIVNSAHHPKEFFRELWATIAAGRVWKGAIRNRAKDGSFYWVNTTIAPLPGPDGKPQEFVAIRTDITRNKQAELELQERNLQLKRASAEATKLADQAQAASRAKSEFLAMMSHEIRTPMNGILGMTELLQQTGLDARQRELADSLAASGKALLTIINDILDLSKIEAGRMTLVAEEFELRPLVEGVVGLLAHSTQGKAVSVRAEMDTSLPARFRGDAGRLRQVLLNLVGNGLKFTAAGSVVTCVRQLATEKGKGLRFEVTDTGAGIPPAKRALLFQPFQQLDSSAARRHGGTGLGLAISRRLIELMGGRMGVESEEGKGSTFWFEVTLPVVAAPSEVSLADLRVLVAQSHAIQRRLTLLSLEKLGCHVDAVGSGKEILERLQAEHYDAVFFEAQLADLEGVALARAIRAGEAASADANRRGVRLILLDAGALAEEPDRIVAAGIDAMLNSPVTPAALKAALPQTTGLVARPNSATPSPSPTAKPTRPA